MHKEIWENHTNRINKHIKIEPKGRKNPGSLTKRIIDGRNMVGMDKKWPCPMDESYIMIKVKFKYVQEIYIYIYII